jgi:hypothetical protein
VLRFKKATFASVAAVQAAAKLVDADRDGSVDDVLITHGSDTIEILNLGISKLDASHIMLV